uniref:Odorant receptor n=1 Tax=Bombyx mori TaxID=7091 RepID=C4B7Y9_BOMMO|nr:olfactory receptor 61 [Bombyx mori]BAH66355.1 olfactory receptor [Bombyx mori]
MARITDVFRLNFIFWKFLGIWGKSAPSKYNMAYTALYLSASLFVYDIFLTLNLIHTPRKLETLLRETMFYFNHLVAMTKILKMFIRRKKILVIFDLLDCEEFKPSDEDSQEIMKRKNEFYYIYWRIVAVTSNLSCFMQVVGPLIKMLIWKSELGLPVCKYYFMSDEFRNKYFVIWYIYQSFGIYNQMVNNLNLDTFNCGMLWMAVGQLQILKTKFVNFKLNDIENSLDLKTRDDMQTERLRKYLTHYEIILKYCATVQDILNITIFVQLGMSSIVICVGLCGFVAMPSNTETAIFMSSYLITMTMQIFVPSWMGTQISFECGELMSAAYCCEWIPRSKLFKRSLILFVERAKTPVRITGLKIFTLSLDTFTSIMKTTYSFFTLIRQLQVDEVN